MAISQTPWKYEKDLPCPMSPDMVDVVTDAEGYVVADIIMSHEDGYLIAVAPDLLKALEDLLGLAQQMPALQPGGWEHETIEQARVAIAKAKEKS